jgi:hypothetical protein
MKALSVNKMFRTFDIKETIIESNGVHVEAYLSHNFDSIRGLTNVSFIYLEEADFFLPWATAKLLKKVTNLKMSR